jgi:hypothetical protein
LKSQQGSDGTTKQMSLPEVTINIHSLQHSPQGTYTLYPMGWTFEMLFIWVGKKGPYYYFTSRIRIKIRVLKYDSAVAENKE